jgi:hypothetical protein
MKVLLGSCIDLSMKLIGDSNSKAPVRSMNRCNYNLVLYYVMGTAFLRELFHLI